MEPKTTLALGFRKAGRAFLILIVAAFPGGCANDEPGSGDTTPAEQPSVAVPLISYSVVSRHNHDPGLFTEGLLVHNGDLYESTGSPPELPQTRSVIGISDLQTGKFTTKAELDRSRYFGEGIAILNGTLYQLTYKTGTGFIYDAGTFRQKGRFRFSNAEGWGMTTDGSNLIMSDGSSKLTYLDPGKLAPVKTLSVTEDGYAIDRLNELEVIRGYIYANIWMSHMVVKIDPATGKVVGKLDLSALARQAAAANPGVDVTNGIAYDASTDRIYVTGKLWPYIYQISFAH